MSDSDRVVATAAPPAALAVVAAGAAVVLIASAPSATGMTVAAMAMAARTALLNFMLICVCSVDTLEFELLLSC